MRSVDNTSLVLPPTFPICIDCSYTLMYRYIESYYFLPLLFVRHDANQTKNEVIAVWVCR